MTPTRTVDIGGETRRVERVSARKASRALAILRHISTEVPALARAWSDADAEYRRTHVLELTRTEARLRYPPSPLLDRDTRAPIREPERIPNPDYVEGDEVDLGTPETIPNPRAGELVVVPSPVDHISEDDWRESDQRLRLPEAPKSADLVPAVFGRALELAEEHVYRLLALFLIPNEEIARRRRDGSLDEEIAEQADTLVDVAFADELIELAVVCGELVDDQFVGKVRDLGDRAGNALRLVGLDPARLKAPTSGPTSSRQTSSTDGPTDSDGTPTPSSTPTGASSNGSANATTSESPPLEQNSKRE